MSKMTYNVSLTPVESSNVRFIGWRDEHLFVTFDGDRHYAYADKGGTLFGEMVDAPSKGRFVHERLKGQDYVTLDGHVTVECPNDRGAYVHFTNPTAQEFAEKIEIAVEANAAKRRFDEETALIVVPASMEDAAVESLRNAFGLGPHQLLKGKTPSKKVFFLGTPRITGVFVPREFHAGDDRPAVKAAPATKTAPLPRPMVHKDKAARPSPKPRLPEAAPDPAPLREARVVGEKAKAQPRYTPTTTRGREAPKRKARMFGVDGDDTKAYVAALLQAVSGLAKTLGVSTDRIQIALAYDVPELEALLRDCGFAISTEPGRPHPKAVMVSGPVVAQTDEEE